MKDLPRHTGSGDITVPSKPLVLTFYPEENFKHCKFIEVWWSAFHSIIRSSLLAFWDKWTAADTFVGLSTSLVFVFQAKTKVNPLYWNNHEKNRTGRIKLLRSSTWGATSNDLGDKPVKSDTGPAHCLL